MLSIAKNEQLSLKYLVEYPENIYKFDQNYYISQLGKDLFETIKILQNNGISISKDHLLSEGNKINSLINEITIETLYSVTYEYGQFPYYLKRLKKDYAKHNISQCLLEDTLKETTKKGELDIDKIKNLIISLEENLTLIEGKENIMISLENWMDKHKSIMYKRANGTLQHSFGDPYLDGYINGGATPGIITTIYGATGCGKSAYTLNLVNKCINRQIPCIYDSLEMDGISTMDRLIAMRNRIPMKNLFPDKEGNISENIFELIDRQRTVLSKLDKFFFIEDPDQKISDIDYIVKEAKRKFKSDYLIFFADLYTMFTDASGDAIYMEKKVNELNRIVKRHNIHFVAIVQANRELEGQKPRDLQDLDRFRVTLKQIKNCGAIGERSRVILSLFRAKYYATKFFQYSEDETIQEELQTMLDIADVQILKQNQGSLATLKYLFDSDNYNFYKYINNKES